MWGCALGPFEASALMATSPRKEERRRKLSVTADMIRSKYPAQKIAGIGTSQFGD